MTQALPVFGKDTGLMIDLTSGALAAGGGGYPAEVETA